jgi:chemotaxis protein MotB
LFNKEDPLNPVNRRISLIVMNKKAEQAAQHDGGVVKLDGDPDESDSDGSLENGLEAVSGVSVAPTGTPATSPAQ